MKYKCSTSTTALVFSIKTVHLHNISEIKHIRRNKKEYIPVHCMYSNNYNNNMY